MSFYIDFYAKPEYSLFSTHTYQAQREGKFLSCISKIPTQLKIAEWILSFYIDNKYEPRMSQNEQKKNKRNWVLYPNLEEMDNVKCNLLHFLILTICKIALLIPLLIALPISNYYRNSYKIPNYFPTIKAKNIEMIYKHCPNLKKIKTDKNRLNVNKAKDSDIRYWFIKNKKSLKEITELNLSKKAGFEDYSLKNSYLNDLLNLFPNLEKLNLQNTSANIINFGKIPKSVKEINLSKNNLMNNFFYFNFEGASNINIDISGNGFSNKEEFLKQILKTSKKIKKSLNEQDTHVNITEEEIKKLKEDLKNKNITFRI
jgi:hypothetical protein